MPTLGYLGGKGLPPYLMNKSIKNLFCVISWHFV